MKSCSKKKKNIWHIAKFPNFWCLGNETCSLSAAYILAELSIIYWLTARVSYYYLHCWMASPRRRAPEISDKHQYILTLSSPSHPSQPSRVTAQLVNPSMWPRRGRQRKSSYKTELWFVTTALLHRPTLQALIYGFTPLLIGHHGLTRVAGSKCII